MRTPVATAARFNIGEAASRAGVSNRMARHYEALGLLPAVPRTYGGYRHGNIRYIGRQQT